MKKIRILIFVLIGILLLSCATIAVLYFTTDIFKTNQELFYKYTGKAIESKAFLTTDENKELIQKMETEKSKTTMGLSINSNTSYTDYEGYESTSIINYSYSSASDPENKLVKGNLGINYDGQELSVDFVKDGDLYGFLVKDVLNQYVAIENKNLKELAEKLGMPSDEVPDKIEEFKLSDVLNDTEKINAIIEKYTDLVIKEIPEVNYSKVKETTKVNDKDIEAVGYRLTLTDNDLYNIINIILNNLKNDEEVFDLIKSEQSEITFKEYKDTIEDLLTDLEESKSGIENKQMVIITTYQKNQQVVKFEVKLLTDTEKQMVFTIENLNNQEIYKLSIESIDKTYYDEKYVVKAIKEDSKDNKQTWDITISSITGKEEQNIATAKIVTTKTDNKIETDLTFDLEYNDQDYGIKQILTMTGNMKIEFTDQIETEKLTTDNSFVLNNSSAEDIQLFMQMFMGKLYEKMGMYSITEQANEAQEALDEQNNTMMNEIQVVE